MNINATLLGQMITFAILIWFTMRFVWPPVIAALNARQKKIADGIAAAEQSQQELVRAQKKFDELIREAKQQATSILEQADKRANQVVEGAKIEARQEGDRIVTAAKNEIEQAYQRAKEELREHVVSLVLVGVEKILEQSINQDAHHKTLDKLLSDLRV